MNTLGIFATLALIPPRLALESYSPVIHRWPAAEASSRGVGNLDPGIDRPRGKLDPGKPVQDTSTI